MVWNGVKACALAAYHLGNANVQLLTSRRRADVLTCGNVVVCWWVGVWCGGFGVGNAMLRCTRRPDHWQTFVGTLSGTTVSLHMDSGNHIHGTIDRECDNIPWDNKSDWCRQGSNDCKHPPPSPPPPPPRDLGFVKRVHVTSMNHLDVGFIDPGGGEPPATALDVLNRQVHRTGLQPSLFYVASSRLMQRYRGQWQLE